jgi:hypothetical protein
MYVPSSNNQIQSPPQETEEFDIQEELKELWSEAAKKYSKNKRLLKKLKSMPNRNSVEALPCQSQRGSGSKSERKEKIEGAKKWSTVG